MGFYVKDQYKAQTILKRKRKMYVIIFGVFSSTQAPCVKTVGKHLLLPLQLQIFWATSQLSTSRD